MTAIAETGVWLEDERRNWRGMEGDGEDGGEEKKQVETEEGGKYVRETER